MINLPTTRKIVTAMMLNSVYLERAEIDNFGIYDFEYFVQPNGHTVTRVTKTYVEGGQVDCYNKHENYLTVLEAVQEIKELCFYK